MIGFFVPGVPVPKGSAKAFVVKGRAIVTQTNREKQRPWASLISYTAQEVGIEPAAGAIILGLIFTMPRPKSHYRTGKFAGELRLNQPIYHTAKPDLDKLIRCVLDALTGIAYWDDSQVVEIRAVKMYGERPGVQVRVEEIG